MKVKRNKKSFGWIVLTLVLLAALFFSLSGCGGETDAATEDGRVNVGDLHAE